MCWFKQNLWNNYLSNEIKMPFPRLLTFCESFYAVFCLVFMHFVIRYKCTLLISFLKRTELMQQKITIVKFSLIRPEILFYFNEKKEINVVKLKCKLKT